MTIFQDVMRRIFIDSRTGFVAVDGGRPGQWSVIVITGVCVGIGGLLAW